MGSRRSATFHCHRCASIVCGKCSDIHRFKRMPAYARVSKPRAVTKSCQRFCLSRRIRDTASIARTAKIHGSSITASSTCTKREVMFEQGESANGGTARKRRDHSTLASTENVVFSSMEDRLESRCSPPCRSALWSEGHRLLGTTSLQSPRAKNRPPEANDDDVLPTSSSHPRFSACLWQPL